MGFALVHLDYQGDACRGRGFGCQKADEARFDQAANRCWRAGKKSAVAWGQDRLVIADKCTAKRHQL